MSKSAELGHAQRWLNTETKKSLFGIGRLLSYLPILVIRIYQNSLGLVFPPSCRFHPSCSEYAIGAFKRFGLFRGAWLAFRRLCRCHPFSPGGLDPLP